MIRLRDRYDLGRLLQTGKFARVAKRSSSSRWKSRQEKDPFVRRARMEGYRSRAVFKLIEMHERDRLIASGDTVVDLGATPGGWSQFAAAIVGDRGRVIAIDIIPMDPIDGVTFIHGDFREDEILVKLHDMAAPGTIDLVMSDMAPNITGVRGIDQPRAMHLADLALDMARKGLKPGGTLVLKLFHGEGFDDYVREVRQAFADVRVRKPAASRPQSRETYLVARNYRV